MQTHLQRNPFREKPALRRLRRTLLRSGVVALSGLMASLMIIWAVIGGTLAVLGLDALMTAFGAVGPIALAGWAGIENWVPGAVLGLLFFASYVLSGGNFGGMGDDVDRLWRDAA